jgi:hypothetical protein
MNWRGVGRKRSWPSFMVVSQLLSRGTEQNAPPPKFRQIMKNVVFWDVARCSSGVNRRFGGTLWKPQISVRLICVLAETRNQYLLSYQSRTSPVHYRALCQATQFSPQTYWNGLTVVCRPVKYLVGISPILTSRTEKLQNAGFKKLVWTRIFNENNDRTIIVFF